MSAPLFSIVLIARNEARTLPRLLSSLAEFQSRGGEVVLVDTGSTDGTPDVAEGLGCLVVRVGDRFVRVIDEELAREINARFVVGDEAPIVQAGDRLFDYAAARNYAAGLASNDVVAMPDCDEVWTRLDISRINSEIESGVGRLEYHFVFSHDEHGAEAIKFLHSKFYDRRKLHWVGIVHEVLAGEQTPTVYLPEQFAKLEHWQNPETSRKGYLTGLALDCFLHPDNDRNSHYFARELLWRGRPRSAIREFERHIAMDRWPTERAQSQIFIGDAWAALGDATAACRAYHEAFLMDGERREPLLRLAHLFYRVRDAKRTAAYASAALPLPLTNFYANQMQHYREDPHEMLYWALWELRDFEGARAHWRKALEYQPLSTKFLHDARFFVDLPPVTIIVPTLGREEKLRRLLELIAQHANYPRFEVVVVKDAFGDKRQGVPRLVRSTVDSAKTDWVCYLGNDCAPEPNFLILAALKLLDTWPDGVGLVGFNDGYWVAGEIATHWLASKRLLPDLDGEFFHTGYHHCGCDNELTERCRKLGRYAWAKEACVAHEHPIRNGFRDMDEVNRIAYEPQMLAADRALLKKRAEQLGFAYHENYVRPVEGANT